MTQYLDPGGYLPHVTPMILLDTVIAVQDNSAHCQVCVGRQGVLAVFLDKFGKLPGWFALELMAQTVGVWSGWHQHQKGEAQVTCGMVLGARELVCPVGGFAEESVLNIHISLLMRDENFGSFDAVIYQGVERVAHGRITTFQPDRRQLAQLFARGKQ